MIHSANQDPSTSGMLLLSNSHQHFTSWNVDWTIYNLQKQRQILDHCCFHSVSSFNKVATFSFPRTYHISISGTAKKKQMDYLKLSILTSNLKNLVSQFFKEVWEIGFSFHWKSFHHTTLIFLFCKWNISFTKRVSDYGAAR